MRRPLRADLPRWLLTWLVCVALNLGLADMLRVDSRWWLTIPVLLLWCLALAAAERFGRFWAMLALCALALGLCLLLSDRELLAEAARKILSRAGAANGYAELVLLLVCAAAALPLSALMRFYGVRVLLSLGWAALWIAAALLEWPLPRLVPAALTPLLLLTVAETIRRLRREKEPGEALKQALLLSLLPAALLLALLPAPAEPYGYPLLRSVAETVEELWHDAETALRFRHRGDQEFGLSFNGFSDEARTGEGTEEEDRSIIYASPKLAPDGAVYLFGNAWDHFDGRNWSSSLKPEAAESLNWSLDTAERVYALWRMLNRSEESPAAFSDYYRLNSVYLSCRNMNVRTMFTVMNATHIFTDAERFPYADAPTGSLFDYVQRDEVWYRVYFLEPNARTHSALIAFAEGTAFDPEADGPLWYQVAEDFSRSFRLDLGDDVNLEAAFARREELIRRVYLDCTGVSDRAGALAKEITAGCGSDAEKVAAIAAYLQEHYSYTLRPEPVPKDENFLDWVLFEGREGYCSWYATAAALLARSVGVPARYVQGYRGKLPGDMFTPLTSGDAHAWCECYITGYGWVTVEATPGFQDQGVGWLTAEEQQALSADAAETAAASEEDLPLNTVDESEMDLPPLSSPADQDNRVEEPASEPEAPAKRFGWLPPLLSAALPAAPLTVWLWLRARRKRRYAEADPATRLLMDLEVLLRDLRGKGYPRKPEESLRQYFARLPWSHLLASETEAEKMAALYDRAFFSPAAPSEEELARHRAFAARFRPRTLRQWIIWHSLQQ